MKIRSASCVIIDNYDRLLLLHSEYDETSGWDLPGGLLDEEESPEAAAARWAREQLGVEVRLVRSLGSGGYADDQDEYQYYWFEAAIRTHEPRVYDQAYADDYDYFEFEDLMSLALSLNVQVLIPKIVSGEVALKAR